MNSPINIKAENRHEQSFAVKPGLTKINYVFTADTERSQEELEKFKSLSLQIKLEAKKQWLGCKVLLKITHGVSKVHETEFYLGYETEHHFTLNGVKNSFTLTYDFLIDETFVSDSSFHTFDTEIADCTLIEEKNIEDVVHNRALVEAGLAYANAIGLGRNYLTDELVDHFMNDVTHHLKSKKGFSAVRLGDGEGRVLAYPDQISDQEIVTQVINYHFGPISMKEISRYLHQKNLSDQLGVLHSLLKYSLLEADYIGLPICSYFDKRESQISSGMKGYAMGILAAGKIVSRQLEKKCIFGTNFFQTLAESHKTFSRIFDGEPTEIVTINCHDLRSAITSTFKVNCPVSAILTPPHYTWSSKKGHGQFPFLYKHTVQEIQNRGDLGGKLFLVGAGILGKHYCHVVKLKGGVALDIGSVFDSWAREGRPDAVRQRKIADLS